MTMEAGLFGLHLLQDGREGVSRRSLPVREEIYGRCRSAAGREHRTARGISTAESRAGPTDRPVARLACASLRDRCDPGALSPDRLVQPAALEPAPPRASGLCLVRQLQVAADP